MERPLSRSRFLALLLLSFGWMAELCAQDKFGYRSSQTENFTPISVSVSGKLALCSHNDKGMILLDVTGGVQPYTFRWNTNEVSQNRTNLFAGTYTVDITDANGVIHTERIVIQPPFPLILDPLEKRDASCGSGGDGYAKIGVKIGRGEPYKVYWSHGLQDAWEASNLSPGTYTVTVADKYNCEVSVSFEIEAENEGMALAESIQQPSCGENPGGEINLQVSGGRAPYQVSWSHGPSTPSISGLAPGNYSVMIIDQAGCSIQASYTLQAPEQMKVEAEVKNVSCGNQEDGAITLTIQGGQSPYTVSWSTGQSGASLDGLPAGTYQASVTDANGCTASQNVTLGSSSSLALKLQELQGVSCFGVSDGRAQLDLGGDQTGATIRWSDGVTGLLVRDDLPAGNYEVWAENSQGCIVSTSFQIDSPVQLTARIESTLDVNCGVGSVQGVAWVSIQGGKEPYTISWSEGNASNREINFFQTTTLSVTVTDAAGCTVETASKVDFPRATTAEGRLDFNYRKLSISNEPEVQVDEEIIFESEISEEFIAWEWAFGDGKQSLDKDPIHVFEKAGTYEVTLTGYDLYGCSSIETNTVQVNMPQDMVVIPNAFTPNGDGLNDTFMPKLKAVNTFTMEIFNTWGERMFSTSEKEDKGWDGTYNGQLIPAGNYLYKITYTTPQGEIAHRSGGVTLIR